jgi:methyl-accepting chemotaxis protein
MASATYKPTMKNDPVDQLKDAGNQAIDKVKEVGNQAFDKAKDTAESVGDMAKSAAESVGEKANEYTAAAGHELTEAGKAMAKKMPHEGMAGEASQAIAETIQQSGKYLEDAKLSGMANDLTEVIKTHPIPTMLICLGIGFCLGRAMRD